MSSQWEATAPSNIALVKYMGKIEGQGNRPTNSSLSYTLPHLLSYVRLTLKGQSGDGESGGADSWVPLEKSSNGRALAKFEMSEKGAARFLAHLARIKTRFGFEGSFEVASANDFPSDCGLASSASSFAALTKVACVAISELTNQSTPSIHEVADLSRQGSGSSCRSFFEPWSIWSENGADEVPALSKMNLIHQAVVVASEVKTVSSSQAHVRVNSSALFQGRPERAELRLENLVGALAKGDWREAFEITWSEFWDMHALFETSHPSFGYMTPGSLEVLRIVRSEFWDKTGDGPLVTMDAGPNVHLLYRNDGEGRKQAEAFEKMVKSKYNVIGSH